LIDELFGRSLEQLESQDSYTLIYLSSATEPTYEAQFAEPLHMELRRQISGNIKRASNETDRSKLPLFEKYQFFTPGTSLVMRLRRD
jgi:hypothetical protein